MKKIDVSNFDEISDVLKWSESDIINDIFNSLDIGIQIVDSKGITVFYNKHCETIDGMRATEFVGKNVTELKEKGILTQPVALEVIERGHKIEKTQFINNRSIYITGTPIKRNDNVLYVVIYVRDISRLEYAKKQLIEVKQLSETRR